MRIGIKMLNVFLSNIIIIKEIILIVLIFKIKI